MMPAGSRTVTGMLCMQTRMAFQLPGVAARCRGLPRTAAAATAGGACVGPWVLRHSLRRAARLVAANRKRTGQGTEQLSHGNGSGGTIGGNRGGSGGSGGGGGGGGGGEHHPRRALALATFKWTVAAAVAGAALLGAAPYALSHPLGLRFALALANLTTPADVWLHLDRLEAGWQQPLQLHGLRLVARCGASGNAGASGSNNGGAPFDPSSSSEEEELPPPQAAGSTVAAGSGGGNGGVAGPSPAQVKERRRLLVSVERVRTPQTLLQLLRGRRVDVIVTKPQLDGTLNAAGTPRLLAVLQQAGLVPLPHPPPKQAAGTATAATAAVSSTGGGGHGQPSSSSSGGSATGSCSAAARQPHPAARTAAAAAGTVSDQEDSDSDHENPLPSLAEAAAAAVAVAAAATRKKGVSGREEGGMQAAATARRKARSLTTSSVSPMALLGYMMPARQAPQKQQVGVSGGGTDGTGGSPTRHGSSSGGTKGWLPESLQHASSAVALSGELRMGAVSVYLSDGALLVPAELRELLGAHVHIEVLRGLATIEEAAADERPAGKVATTGKDGGGSGGSKELKWAHQRPAVLLPWGTGMPQAPVSLRLDSQTMQFKLQGWQTARGYTYLHRPIEASMQFTPALSRYLFAYLHPALGGTVGLKSSTAVQAKLMPHDRLWPTSQATLRVEPLSVDLGDSPVLRQSAGVLAVVVSNLKLGGSLRAKLSPLQATLSSDGRLSAERLDIRIGLSPWKEGLHLVSWGSASLRPPQALDATVCIPGDALSVLGLPLLPEGAGLPLHIGGTTAQPRVEVGSVTKQLALLLAKQQAAKLAESSRKGGKKGGMSQWLVDQVQEGLGGSEAMSIQMPPPLQWRSFEEAGHTIG